ncbi:MAG: hypothetical protein FWE49_02570 [Synergistaceae bacterium]|nr:hypothetical protein [Synergistaceae bacterium]
METELRARKKETIRRCVVYVMALVALVTTVIGLKGPITENIKMRKEESERLNKKSRKYVFQGLEAIHVGVNEFTYDSVEREEDIGDGHLIYSDKLELLLSLYSTYRASFDNDLLTPPTKEDIIRLYQSYNDYLFDRFTDFSRWAYYLYFYFWSYENALRTAKSVYDQEYGLYKGRWQYGELTAEERIELAQFVRENPGFMPEENYFEELKLFEPITQEAYESIKQEYFIRMSGS